MSDFYAGQEVFLVYDEGKGYPVRKERAVIAEVHEKCLVIYRELNGRTCAMTTRADGRILNWGGNSRIEPTGNSKPVLIRTGLSRFTMPPGIS